jgi:deazaflavin-dependent oxidoreductase (nitroreductase family)
MSANRGPIRKPPGPIGRRLAKAPILLYRAHLGWVLGTRFLMVEHTGRRSGLTRRTALEVIDRGDRTLFVASAWPESDWLRNIEANPDVRVSWFRDREVPATGDVIPVAEAAEVFGRYRDAHPKAAKALAKAIGLPFDDIEAMAATVPIVRFGLREDGLPGER